MKPKRIARTPSLSWKARLGTFVSIFGVIWLFVDPLNTLVFGSNFLPNLGTLGYVGLVIFSAFLTALVEFITMLQLKSRMTFVALNVTLTEDGTQHMVEVPKDMNIDSFISLFLKEQSQHTNAGTYVARHDLYHWFLVAKQGDEYKVVPGDKTIAEAGLLDGAAFGIRGDILPEYAGGLTGHVIMSKSNKPPAEKDVPIVGGDNQRILGKDYPLDELDQGFRFD